MTSKTTDFNDLSNNLTIGYAYNLSGGIKSVTDPYSSVVTYQNDKNGRLTEAGDYTDPQNTTGPYATNIKYRAFGQLKQIDYRLPESETSEIKLEYDNRLRISHSEASMPESSSGFVLKADYTYFADSRLAAKDDLLDNAWDRTVKYDFAGRLSYNQFGLGLASGGQSYKRVYQQAITYDGFSQMTQRSGVHWDNEIGFVEGYTNGRITGAGAPAYDAAGNIVSASTGTTQYEFQNSIFDGSGRRTGTHNSVRGRVGSRMNMITETKNGYQFDGDGRPVVELMAARQFHVNSPPTGELSAVPFKLQVWSTVLGVSLTTVMPSGAKHSTNVYAGGAVIAVENQGVASMKTADPVTGTVANYVYFNSQFSSSTEEQEPLGQNIYPVDPEDPPEPLPNDSNVGSADWPEWQCEAGAAYYGGFSGMPFHCQKRMIEDLSYSLADLFGFSQNPNSPIKLADSPIPSFDFGGSESEDVLAYARTSTSKPDKKKKRKGGSRSRVVQRKEALATVQSQPASDPFEFIDVSKDLADATLLRKYTYFKSFIEENVKFIGDPNGLVMSNRSALIARLAWLVGLKACNDIFKAKLGKTPFEVIKASGVYITDYGSLSNPEVRTTLGLSPEQATELQSYRDEKQPTASTLTKLPVGLVTVFNEQDINVSWLGSFFYGPVDEAKLDEAVVHESIHVAGKDEDQYRSTFFYNHDLNNWKPYNEVVDKCKIPLR